DHVVALSNAWQTGAQALDVYQRELIATEPLNPPAVNAPTNQSKGDGDAATWLPPAKGYRCAYVARQVAVKTRYKLWVTPAERDAIARVLPDAPAQALPEWRSRHAAPTCAESAPGSRVRSPPPRTPCR